MALGQDSDDEAVLGQEQPQQVDAELRALAAELRRVLALAVDVRPLSGELAAIIAQAAGRRTQGRVRFGAAYQGPPGHVHGAMVAAMYDDLLGSAQLVAGFTGSITVTYLRPTPLHSDLEVAAWVNRVQGRKRWLRGTCHLDGILVSEAEGLFIAPRTGATLEGIAAHLGEA